MTKDELANLRDEAKYLREAVSKIGDVSARRRLEVNLERLESELLLRLEAATETIRELEANAERVGAILAAAIEEIPSAAVIVEAPSGKILYSNHELSRMTGEKLPHANSVSEYDQYGNLHLDGRPYITEEYPVARAVEKGETIINEVLYYRCAGGEMRKLSVSAHPIRDSQGKIVAGIGLSYDITSTEKSRAS